MRAKMAILLALVLLALGSCSVNKPSWPSRDGEAGGDPMVQGLPALDKLQQPSRDISDVPIDGYLSLDPRYPLATSNAVQAGGSLNLDNSINVMTYALYGVGGFDGDNYPSGVKLDVSTSAGLFYLAFSDYISGNWTISGPFDDDGEFGIPTLDGHYDRSAFQSAKHHHYFAIIVPNGSSVSIDGLWLGVNGGDTAPEPVYPQGGMGSTNGFEILWYPSDSCHDPDFSGYIVERAPLFSGPFQPLAAEPSNVVEFVDTSAVLDETYRYRIVTYDSAGNKAIGPYIIDGPKAGEEALPVIVPKLPRDFFYAPATIEVDLSASYDPEGEGIIEYKIYAQNPLPVEYAGPVAQVELGPGCHVLSFGVKCADGRQWSSFAYVKVLPQWQSQSTVLHATEHPASEQAARLTHYRAGVQPSDGLTTLCGLDSASRTLSFWHQQGSEMLPYRVKNLEQVHYVGEPLSEGDSLLFPVATESFYYIACFDGSSTSLVPLTSHKTDYNVILLKDNDGVYWFCDADSSPGNEKVLMQRLSDAETELEVASVSDAVECLDAVLEPVSGHFFVFYDDGTALNFSEWDPVAEMSVDGGAIGPASIGALIDAEINPQNGHVAVMYWNNPTNRLRYFEQDGLGGWTPRVDIDGSSNGLPEGDLCPSADGVLNAFFALDNGQQAHRYTYSGNVWSMVNTSSYSSDSGYSVALAQVPGSPDMRVADTCSDGTIRLARLKPADTDNGFASIDSSLGQGFDMHAAAGTDGLHLLYANANDPGNPVHLISPAGPDEGSVWNSANSFTADAGLNLKATSEGQVYATGYKSPNAILYWWDSGAGNFVNEQSFAALQEHRPILGPGISQDIVTFGVWDDTGGLFQQFRGKHGSYNPLNYVLDVSPVWEGAYAGTSGLEGFFYGADFYQDSPRFFFHGPSATIPKELGEASTGSELSPFNKPSCIGRCLDAAYFWNGQIQYGGIAVDLLCANGSTFSPTRYIKSFLLEEEVIDLPIGTLNPEGEFRRTVSVMQSNGLTAVELVSSAAAEETSFAWSNFGDWESLDLAPGLDNMSLPLLLTGNDGRWHIIYKNWKTDEIMIRSSI